MASNVLRPEEWIELASALAAGEDVGQQLMERERRFDNYFQDLNGIYTPEVGQRDTALFDNGYTFVTTSGSRVRGLRVGSWVMLSVVCTAGSSLAFGATASGIVITVPLQLGMESGESCPIGTFTWYDQSATTYYTGAAFSTITNGYGVDAESYAVYGQANNTGVAAPIGAGINLTSSDRVYAHLAYNTAFSKSLA